MDPLIVAAVRALATAMGHLTQSKPSNIKSRQNCTISEAVGLSEEANWSGTVGHLCTKLTRLSKFFYKNMPNSGTPGQAPADWHVLAAIVQFAG